MSDVLAIEYQMNAVVCILERLEREYNEDSEFEIKYLAAVMKGYLKTIQSDTRDCIDYIDRLTVEEK